MASKSFIVTLVRHGQTTHNKSKIIQGQMETHLTDLGREQARLLRDHHKETKEKFDKVYSSDLIRAYETCQIVCDNQYEIIKNQLLRERCFGVLQGKPLDNLRAEAYKAGHNETNFTEFRPEGGETMDEFQGRVQKFCQEELFPKAEDSSSIMVVSHGGVIREFMKYFKQLGCDIGRKEFIISPNTGSCIFEIKLDGENKVEQVTAKVLHSIPHLKSDARDEALTEEQLNEKVEEKEVEHAV